MEACRMWKGTSNTTNIKDAILNSKCIDFLYDTADPLLGVHPRELKSFTQNLVHEGSQHH